MRKELIALISLVGLVILAGCTNTNILGGGTATTGAPSGVIITTFGPDIPEVFSGDPVTFTAQVQNIGEEDATGVTARLFGLGTDWTVNTPASVTIGDLPKAQPSMSVPGGEGSATWDVTSPSGLKVDNSYVAKVRVTYGYATTGLGNIKVYNSDYLKTITPSQATQITSSSGLASFTVSNGPVTVELAGAARPFIVKAGGTLTGTIVVLLSNKGQGNPFNAAETDRQVTVNSITVNNAPCINSINANPTIPRTGKTSISCQFSISAADVPDFRTIPISIELNYNYYLDQDATVKVLQTLS